MANKYPLSIPKHIQQVVDAVRTAKLAELQEYDSTIETISYMHGNIKEIIQILAQKTANDTLRFQKYPLFILIEDITIDRRTSNYYGVAPLEVIICNHTKKDYNSMQREDINFDPILRPLYQEFMFQLFKHKGFVIQNDMFIPHEYAERKYWGEDDNTKNKLGDYIDAIHLTDLRITLDRRICEISLIIE